MNAEKKGALIWVEDDPSTITNAMPFPFFSQYNSLVIEAYL